MMNNHILFLSFLCIVYITIYTLLYLYCKDKKLGKIKMTIVSLIVVIMLCGESLLFFEAFDFLNNHMYISYLI